MNQTLALTTAKHADVTHLHMYLLKSKSSRVMEGIQVSVSEHSGGFREGTKRRGTGQSDGTLLLPVTKVDLYPALLPTPPPPILSKQLLNKLLPNNCTQNRSRQATACPLESSSEARLAPGPHKSTTRLAHEHRESRSSCWKPIERWKLLGTSVYRCLA